LKLLIYKKLGWGKMKMRNSEAQGKEDSCESLSEKRIVEALCESKKKNGYKGRIVREQRALIRQWESKNFAREDEEPGLKSLCIYEKASLDHCPG